MNHAIVTRQQSVSPALSFSSFISMSRHVLSMELSAGSVNCFNIYHLPQVSCLDYCLNRLRIGHTADLCESVNVFSYNWPDISVDKFMWRSSSVNWVSDPKF